MCPGSFPFFLEIHADERKVNTKNAPLNVETTKLENGGNNETT